MNYLKIRFWIISLTLIVINCNNIDERLLTLETIKSSYKKDFIEAKGKQAYVITALEGCGACIEYTIRFIEKNIDNKQMLFVVSGRSKKELTMKFSKKVINNKNFIFDNKLIALRGKIIDSIHPKIFLINQNKVINSYEVVYTSADSLFNVTYDYLK